MTNLFKILFFTGIIITSCSEMEKKILYNSTKFILLNTKDYENDFIPVLKHLKSNNDSLLKKSCKIILEKVDSIRTDHIENIVKKPFPKEYLSSPVGAEIFYKNFEQNIFNSKKWLLNEAVIEEYNLIDERIEILNTILMYYSSYFYPEAFYYKQHLRMSVTMMKSFDEYTEWLHDLDYIYFKSGDEYVKPFDLYLKLNNYYTSNIDVPYYLLQPALAKELLKKITEIKPAKSFYEEEKRFWETVFRKVCQGEVIMIVDYSNL